MMKRGLTLCKLFWLIALKIIIMPSLLLKQLEMLVDGGVRIGPEMKLQHGQPNEIVSMQSIKR